MPRDMSGCEDAALMGAREIPFWLQILAEHALFIKSGLNDEAVSKKQEAEAYSVELFNWYRQAEQGSSARRYSHVLRGSLPVMKSFLAFQQDLLEALLRCRQKGWLYPLLIDHMIRESLYAIKLFEMFLNQLLSLGKIKRCYVSKPQENLFWVEIAGNHAQFLYHWTDPSERNVLQTAQTFQEEFDQLYLQGRDYGSMLRRIAEEPPAFERYYCDVRKATGRFKDFLKLAEELIQECQLLGVIPPLLADHLRRETEYDLLLRSLIIKGKVCPCAAAKAEYGMDEDCDTESEYLMPQFKESCSWEETVTADTEDTEDTPDYIDPAPDCCCSEDAQETEVEEIVEAANVKIEEIEEPEPQEPLYCLPPEMSPPCSASELEPKASKAVFSSNKSNYKWKSHWPRPLGQKPR